MEKINLDEICRICMIKQQNMTYLLNYTNIYDDTKESLINILNTLTNEQIKFDELYPKLICDVCVNSAVQAYNFKLQCDRSWKLLEEYINKLVDDTKVDIIENVERKLQEENANSITSTTDIISYKHTRRKTKRGVPCETEDSADSNVKENNSLDATQKSIGDICDTYFCLQCHKSFKNKYILTTHLKRHTLKGQFLCNICGKGFNSQSCLTRHSRVHTGEKNYECSMCEKKFSTSYNLNLHFRTHSGEKPYLCVTCGKRFSHPTGLTYHTRTHTKERPYTCDVCKKKFVIQCHLEHHKKIHTGERPFACVQCDKAFIKKIDLQRHEAVHSGLKPHNCTICSKTFLRKRHLKEHMMIHTDERPHVCVFCGKGFIRAYSLKDHVTKHHN